MAAAAAISQPCSIRLPSPSPVSRQKLAFLRSKTATTNLSYVISASGRDLYGHHYDGKLVDDNMIVLRMRIQDIEMQKSEKNEAPSDWMQWEKMYFVNYCSYIDL